MRLEFQKLKIPGLCCCVHPVIVNKKERYYFICVRLIGCYAKEGVSYSNKKNDSNPD